MVEGDVHVFETEVVEAAERVSKTAVVGREGRNNAYVIMPMKVSVSGRTRIATPKLKRSSGKNERLLKSVQHHLMLNTILLTQYSHCVWRWRARNSR